MDEQDKNEIEQKNENILMTKYEYIDNLNIIDFERENFVNSIEEETLLEYVESFRRQFVQIFPSRQESLFLSPLNEFGVRKFVCSSIRPTLQRFVNLWDYQKCIEFICSSLSYIPLKQETQVPDLLISNDILLKIRYADCLDYSNLACSLLRGAGYNAFIVYGIANYQITQNIQTNNDINPNILNETKWIFHDDDNDHDDEDDENNDNDDDDFEIPQYYDYKKGSSSNKKITNEEIKTYKEYLLEKENALKNKKKAELDKLESIQQKELFDPLKDKRVHFWILIKKGLRDIENDFFVEPVSGNIYKINDENLPFIRIESIWNDKNYWVNVQNTNCIGNMSFDLNDTKCWEFILFDQENKDENKENDENNEQEKKEKIDEKEEKEILTLPKCWMKPFFITQKDIDYPFPNNHKIINYNKCKLEKYNKFYNKNGLILKLTLFKDNTRLIIQEIREIFKDRHDLLIKRVTKIGGIKYELYDIGRNSGLYQLININKQIRITKFYDNSRIDNLIKRKEIFGKKIIETFKNDSIIKRIIYLNNNNKHKDKDNNQEKEFGISKIEQYYSKLIKNDNHENIRLLTFDILNEKYIINYHYGQNRILSKNITFNKKTGEVNGWTPDPLNKNPSTIKLKQQFQDLIIKEKNIMTEIRERERNFNILINKLSQQRQINNLKLLKDSYTISKEIIKESSLKDMMIMMTNNKDHQINTNDDEYNDNDYSMLHSFLPNNNNNKTDNNLNREQIDQIKEDCLRSLKERLVSRLNIITRRLHSEIEKLEDIKTKYEDWQNNDIEHGDQIIINKWNENQDLLNEEKENEFKLIKSEIEFKIKIIKQRLSRHEQQSINKMNSLSDLLDCYFK